MEVVPQCIIKNREGGPDEIVLPVDAEAAS